MTEPGVLVLSGPPCAGKSSVGWALASRAGLTLVEIDAVFDLLLPGSDRNRSDRMLAYDAAHGLARLLLERGRTSVLECTYARREQRASLVAALADVPAAPVWVVEVAVSADDAVERFRQRRSTTDLDDVLVRERAEHFPYSEHAFWLESSTGRPADLARLIDHWLAGPPTPVDREGWARAGRDWA